MSVNNRGSIFPNGDPFYTNSFEIIEDLGMVSITGLGPSDFALVETFIGDPCGGEWVPFSCGCCQKEICPSQTQSYFPIPGIYRLRFDSRHADFNNDTTWFNGVRAYNQNVNSNLNLTEITKGDCMSCGNHVICTPGGIVIDGEMCSFPTIPTYNSISTDGSVGITPSTDAAGNTTFNFSVEEDVKLLQPLYSDTVVTFPMSDGTSYQISLADLDMPDDFLGQPTLSGDTLTFPMELGDVHTVDLSKFSETLVNNGDGTYTFNDGEGNLTTFAQDTFSTTVDNGNGTATVTNTDGTQVDVLTEVNFEELLEDACYDLPLLPTDTCNITKVALAETPDGCKKLFKYDNEPLPQGYRNITQSIVTTFDTVLTGAQTYPEDVGPDIIKETHIEGDIVLTVAEYPGLACAGVTLRLVARANVHYEYDKVNSAPTKPQWGFDLFVDNVRIANTPDDYIVDNTGLNSFVGGEISGTVVTTGNDLTVKVSQYVRYSTSNAADYVGDTFKSDMAQIGVDFSQA